MQLKPEYAAALIVSLIVMIFGLFLTSLWFAPGITLSVVCIMGIGVFVGSLLYTLYDYFYWELKRTKRNNSNNDL